VKITSSQIAMTSTHIKSSSYRLHESWRAWSGERRPQFEGQRKNVSAPDSVVELSKASKSAYTKTASATGGEIAESKAVRDAIEETGGNPRLMLMKFIIEAVTGRRIKLLSDRDLQVDAPSPSETKALPEAQSATASEPPEVSAAGWGVDYDRTEQYREVEQTTFTSSGAVRTADGKEIAFNLSLAMSRSYEQQSAVSVRAGDAVVTDPLVLNFEGTAAQLQNTRVSFDLDSDGQSEEVPLLGGNSAYLALDLDKDDQITSGKELFGPSSGNGYGELAAYDLDGNQFIDENDAIFNELRLWTPSADGTGQLATLQEKNVGALALTNAATPFDLRGAENQSLGTVRSTGVYLTEDGSAGTIQQVDLVV
jgi:hypothetical protein